MLVFVLTRIFFFFSLPFPSIEVVVLQCAYSYSKITQHHSLMQPEVLFKDTPPEVFLPAWCVVLNYTCESLRANQLGVLHFDSSLQGRVSETIPPFFLPHSSLPLREAGDWEKHWSQWKHRLSRRRSPCRDRNNAGTAFHGRKGTNKNTNRVVWAWACPRSFFGTLFPTPLLFLGWSVIKHDGDRSNKNSLQLEYRANK